MGDELRACDVWDSGMCAWIVKDDCVHVMCWIFFPSYAKLLRVTNEGIHMAV